MGTTIMDMVEEAKKVVLDEYSHDSELLVHREPR
jgi:hypothetical protein